MKERIAPVKNLARLQELLESLKLRSSRLPGVGVVYGETGVGKSTGLTWAAVRENAAYVRALRVWSPSSMLDTICEELDIEASRNLARTLRAIVNELSAQNRMLILDEADYLVEKRSLLDTLRDLHDLSAMPLILVGMGDFVKKLKSRIDQKQFNGRIAFECAFQPLDADDTQRVVKDLSEVTIEDDLVAKLHAAAGGSIRLVCVGIERIERHAKHRGLKAIGSKAWGDKPLNIYETVDRPTRIAHDTTAAA